MVLDGLKKAKRFGVEVAMEKCSSGPRDAKVVVAFEVKIF